MLAGAEMQCQSGWLFAQHPRLDAVQPAGTREHCHTQMFTAQQSTLASSSAACSRTVDIQQQSRQYSLHTPDAPIAGQPTRGVSKATGVRQAAAACIEAGVENVDLLPIPGTCRATAAAATGATVTGRDCTATARLPPTRSLVFLGGSKGCLAALRKGREGTKHPIRRCT